MFSESSYGFRAGRGTHQAVLKAREYVGSGKRCVVDLDLEKFFDRINHDVLMVRVARKVGDKRVPGLIRHYLQAGILAGGLVKPAREGTPQGGPLSPLLLNILLDGLERRRHTFCRYDDDCNVYVGSRLAGERVMESLKRFLYMRLRLKVNERKSAVDRLWRRVFLGYTVIRHRQPRLKVASSSVEKLKGKLKYAFLGVGDAM